MAKLPYFRLYVNDFLADPKVMAMDLFQVGAYFKILCIAWLNNPRGSLSDDSAMIQRQLGMSESDWETHKDRILAPFEHRDGRLFQKRMVEEAEKAEAETESRRRGAKATNAKRWSSDTLSDRSACRSRVGNHSHNHTKENKQKKARELAGDVSLLSLSAELDKPEFRKALQDWQEHKQLHRDPLTQRALELIVADCEQWGLEKSIEYIHHAIKKGWKGIFEPNQKQVTSKPRHRDILDAPVLDIEEVKRRQGLTAEDLERLKRLV